MGWNSLRKTRFSNRRADIVDAATRFFVKGDPKRPLDPSVELDFAELESRAKDLYSEKFMESMLATKLDVAVKDLTPGMKAQAKVEKWQRQTERRRKNTLARAALSYPSPERSPNPPEYDLPSSPEPVIVSEEFLSTRKRRNSFSESASDGEGSHRTHKRSR